MEAKPRAVDECASVRHSGSSRPPTEAGDFEPLSDEEKESDARVLSLDQRIAEILIADPPSAPVDAALLRGTASSTSMTRQAISLLGASGNAASQIATPSREQPRT